MKAIRTHAPGGPEHLVYEEAPKPAPATSHVLVRVYATGITPMELTWGESYKTCEGAARIPSIPGHELCGVIEALGPGVTNAQVGDEVYGLTEFCRDGAAADYIVVRASDLALKPRTLDPIQTAAVPLSALTAWQAFFDHANLQKGQRVLIHGGAGGVGSFAVQLAHWHGAHVIATASARDVDFVHELGADEVIDYAATRFDEAVQDVDVVLDMIGGDTLTRSFSVLRPGGILISLVAPPAQEAAEAHKVRGLFFVVEPDKRALTDIAGVIDEGHLKPIIATVLPLERAREAFEHGLNEHPRGKIILQVDPHIASNAAGDQA